jgi:hypothetical protein
VGIDYHRASTENRLSRNHNHGHEQVNGTLWATTTTKAAPFYVGGRALDLHLKIISSVASKVSGFHVMYSPTASPVLPAQQQQVFTFLGDANPNTFTMTNFQPNATTLKVYNANNGQVYVYPAFSVSGSVVTFPAGTFNYPSENVILVFDQVAGGVIDQSGVNATNITGHSSQLSALATQLDPLKYVSVGTIAVPSTAIVGRAQIPDLANDLSARFGIERIMVQNLYQLQSEFGASGEPVWAALNDDKGLIRYVGQWSSVTDAGGQYAQSNLSTDYIETTFYGTGLNWLLRFGTATYPAIQISVDGGTESSLTLSASNSTIISSRN